MVTKLLLFGIFTLFLYGCGDGSSSTHTQESSCAGDINKTYLRITHPLVTQSDLEAAQ